MLRFVLAAAAAAAVGVGALVATAAPALAGNLTKYDGASWYDKYLAVSGGATPVCAGNSGSMGQLAFGKNVDASHECGSQSETSIAINPASSSNVVAGSNEIQRLPMRAMVSIDAGATFTGVDLPLPPPRTSNGFDFGSDPGLAFDSNGNVVLLVHRCVLLHRRLDQRHGDGGCPLVRRRAHVERDVLRPADGRRPVQRQADDHGRHRAGPPQPHLRRVGQRNRQLLVDEERQQRRRVALG